MQNIVSFFSLIVQGGFFMALSVWNYSLQAKRDMASHHQFVSYQRHQICDANYKL